MKEHQSEINELDRLITAQEVQAIIGIKSRVTLWRKCKANNGFPRPYKDGPKFTRWKLSEIQQWIESLRVEESEPA